MRLGGTRIVAVSLLALVAAALAPPAASASSWSVVQLPSGGVNASFYGLSCPGASFCVAVGGNSAIATSTDPTGGASAWKIGKPGGGVELPAFEGEATYGGGQVRGISCPTTDLCVAASLDGRFYTSTDPAGGPSTFKVVKQAESGPNIHMLGVSCPSTAFCVVVGYGGKVLTSSNPTGDSSAWTVTQLAQPVDLRGVSCPSPSFCVAVGNEGEIVASDDPTGGPGAWRSLGAPGGESSLNGISCPGLGLCVTGNAAQILTASVPGGAGGWKAFDAGTGLPITAVSCPSSTACVAVDNNADVLTATDPDGGEGAWSFQNVIPAGSEDGNGMYGVSCPTTSFCAAAGQHYQVMTSTDPFAVDLPKSAKGKGKGPRVVITRHPAKRLDMKKGGVRVAFRFRGIGKVARFQCKLQGHRYRSCGSPKRYRVHKGKTFFRVRAIGPGGVKGPPATYHFRVGGLTERPPVPSCANAPPGAPCINA
jgi:hypothetical protein